MTDPTHETAVEMIGVTRRFAGRPAVDDLSLRIPRGTGLGLIGPNGAGKTTTIKILMGLIRRDAGRVAILGLDPAIDDLTVKQRVGYVPEQQFIYRWMRVSEVIHFARAFYATWNADLADRLMTQFDLPPHKKVKHLSKGAAVKLSLLLAMSHEPDLLILDEPMAGLDPVAREELLDAMVQAICDREQTVILSSHTLADVQRLATRVAILNEGRLKVHAAVDELLAGTKRIRAVLKDGAAPGAPPEQTIWQRVQNREWLLTVKDFSPETVDRLRAANTLDQIEVIDLGLEDIFKDYVRGWRASA
ncbi:MAG: ABC transporter ATP-binding protein [Phycisphaerae bacterium]|nr:ABC transporter ATP-binding protein [Phycisphaerae bacterium]